MDGEGREGVQRRGKRKKRGTQGKKGIGRTEMSKMVRKRKGGEKRKRHVRRGKAGKGG